MRRVLIVVWTVLAFIAHGKYNVVSAQPPDQEIRSIVAAGRLAQSKNDFVHAADAYRKAVALEPNVPELWANLGLMEYELGQHFDAVASFQKAIQLNPSLFVPQLFLGMEYLRLKKGVEALFCLEAALKLNPTDIQVVRSLAEAQAMTGNLDKAIDFGWEAVQLGPTEGRVWFDLGTFYLQQVENDAHLMTSAYETSTYVKLRSAEVLASEGNLIAAERNYRKAVASPAPPPCAFAELGITLLREGDAAAAQEQFERELQTGFRCRLANLGIAINEIVGGQEKTALDQLVMIASLDPAFLRKNLPSFRGVVTQEQLKAFINTAHAKTETTSTIEVAELMTASLRSDQIMPALLSPEDNPQESVQMKSLINAQQLASEGQYSRCEQALKQDKDLRDADRLHLLAFCSFYVSDLRTTSRAGQKLKTSQETRAEGLYWESKAGEALAVQTLAHAGEIDANSPRMHVLLGDIFRQQHNWEEADREYRKALVLEPESHSARLNLAITLFAELKVENALAVDQSLLADSQTDAEANLLAAEILVQLNRSPEAESYLIHCTDLKPALLPHYHALLGKVYAETNRVPAAIAEYRQGLPGDKDGSMHYQLARLYQQSGNKLAAVEAFKESKRLMERANERDQGVLVETEENVHQQ